MNRFERVLEVYLVALTFVATLTVVWGTNRFFLANTTEETGWALMIGITGLGVVLGLGVRHYRRTASALDDRADRYPWSTDE